MYIYAGHDCSKRTNSMKTYNTSPTLAKLLWISFILWMTFPMLPTLEITLRCGSETYNDDLIWASLVEPLENHLYLQPLTSL